MLCSEDPNVVFLMETRLQVRQLEYIRLQTNMGGCVRVDRRGLGGGLALFWKSNVLVQLLSFSVGHINSIVTDPDKRPFRLIGFYANSDSSLQDSFWNLLRRL